LAEEPTEALSVYGYRKCAEGQQMQTEDEAERAGGQQLVVIAA
jgi:hypothetical protein